MIIVQMFVCSKEHFLAELSLRSAKYPQILGWKLGFMELSEVGGLQPPQHPAPRRPVAWRG
jgi:hypothetical protein